jgi:hypothetical protein
MESVIPQEIVWDLFTNYIEAADALQVDAAYRARIASLRDKLAPPGIGSWGRGLNCTTQFSIRRTTTTVILRTYSGSIRAARLVWRGLRSRLLPREHR